MPQVHAVLSASLKCRAVPHRPSSGLPSRAGNGAAPRAPLRVTIPRWSGKWMVGMDGFKNEVGMRLW